MSRPRLAPLILTALVVALVLVPRVASAQQTAAPEQESPRANAEAKAATRPRRDPPDDYLGRRIADVMSFQGADWLIRPERALEERSDAMLDALKLKPGDTVTDVGAGVATRASASCGGSGRRGWSARPRCEAGDREREKGAGLP